MKIVGFYFFIETKKATSLLLKIQMAGDERIELPTVVLETIIIPFN
jgi:hypothetical protein